MQQKRFLANGWFCQFCFLPCRSFLSRQSTCTVNRSRRFDAKCLQQQFSSNANQNVIHLQRNDEPIKLSTSPIKNYKTTKTFRDVNIGTKTSGSMRPIFIGLTFLLALTYVMFFVQGEPLDLFSTEVLSQFEEKINAKLQLNDAITKDNDNK